MNFFLKWIGFTAAFFCIVFAVIGIIALVVVAWEKYVTNLPVGQQFVVAVGTLAIILRLLGAALDRDPY
jgi:hypothetical protein